MFGRWSRTERRRRRRARGLDIAAWRAEAVAEADAGDPWAMIALGLEHGWDGILGEDRLEARAWFERAMVLEPFRARFEIAWLDFEAGWWPADPRFETDALEGYGPSAALLAELHANKRKGRYDLERAMLFAEIGVRAGSLAARLAKIKIEARRLNNFVDRLVYLWRNFRDMRRIMGERRAIAREDPHDERAL